MPHIFYGDRFYCFHKEVVGMLRRYELTGWQYAWISDLLPHDDHPHGGRPWAEHRKYLNGIFWILHTGAQWRELPTRYGKWNSVYCRFKRWRQDGTIAKILKRLQIVLDENGFIDNQLWCIDGSNVRASKSAAGAGKVGEKKRAS
jgi:transposase